MRLVGEKITEALEGKSSAGLAELVHIQLHSLYGGPEFYGMGSMRPEGVVVSLKRVPTKQPRAVRPYAARERVQPFHNYLRCKLPWYGSERGILGQGFDCSQPHIIPCGIPAKPEASGIGYCRVNYGCLFQNSLLTFCSLAQHHRTNL